MREREREREARRISRQLASPARIGGRWGVEIFVESVVAAHICLIAEISRCLYRVYRLFCAVVLCGRRYRCSYNTFITAGLGRCTLPQNEEVVIPFVFEWRVDSIPLSGRSFRADITLFCSGGRERNRERFNLIGRVEN